MTPGRQMLYIFFVFFFFIMQASRCEMPFKRISSSLPSREYHIDTDATGPLHLNITQTITPRRLNF